jgi:hypothetical protein
VDAAFFARPRHAVFFIDGPVFVGGAPSAARFSAQRFFAASEILFRPSALIRLLPAVFLPGLDGPGEDAWAVGVNASTSRNRGFG